jgi:hypothetical protein
MLDELEIYFDLIRQGLTQVGASYYRLRTTYRPTGIVRERIFCYELYHQIRSLMGEYELLSLHGEIDKRGHRDFRREHRRNPDFVFHLPETHAGNMLVVEVKGQLGQDNWAIIKDFETLLAFTSRYQYKAGLFLIYNHTLSELKAKLGTAVQPLADRIGAEKVRIWCSKHAGERPTEVTLPVFGSSAAADPSVT